MGRKRKTIHRPGYSSPLAYKLTRRVCRTQNAQTTHVQIRQRHVVFRTASMRMLVYIRCTEVVQMTFWVGLDFTSATVASGMMLSTVIDLARSVYGKQSWYHRSTTDSTGDVLEEFCAV